ncbi:hypothetical protein JHW43_008228 [Diplocarpon mali]|nr:hypothetical protein JHW43_008228 [Diplocarpon mali]
MNVSRLLSSMDIRGRTAREQHSFHSQTSTNAFELQERNVCEMIASWGIFASDEQSGTMKLAVAYVALAQHETPEKQAAAVGAPERNGRAALHPLGGYAAFSELEGLDRGSWNAPPGVLALGGAGTGAVERRITKNSARGVFESSGAPTNGEYRHELQ